LEFVNVGTLRRHNDNFCVGKSKSELQAIWAQCKNIPEFKKRLGCSNTLATRYVKSWGMPTVKNGFALIAVLNLVSIACIMIIFVALLVTLT